MTRKPRKIHFCQCGIVIMHMLHLFNSVFLHFSNSDSLQYYHGNPDISCLLIPRYGLLWCPVIKGDEILRALATISNISRVVDQVCALNCKYGIGFEPSDAPCALSGSTIEALEVRS